MTEMIRAYPEAAPIIGDKLAQNMDWPGADEIAERFEKMLPPQIKGEQPIPPEVQMLVEQGKEMIAQLTQENEQLKAGQKTAEAKVIADHQARRMQIQADAVAAREKLAADEQIEREKIASNERIAQMKIASEARIASQRAELMASRPPAQPN